jgi:hypothetical protein
MDNKFSAELDKIEGLLSRVDIDLNMDFTKTDFTTFFKNVDRSVEIYNLCLEELCGQLNFFELQNHSKVYRKLYHHYKAQMYNVIKYELHMQKELSEKTEEEKNYRMKIEGLNSKLKSTEDKKSKLHIQLEDQKKKIERLIAGNAKGMRLNDIESRANLPDIQVSPGHFSNKNESNNFETLNNNSSFYSPKTVGTELIAKETGFKTNNKRGSAQLEV